MNSKTHAKQWVSAVLLFFLLAHLAQLTTLRIDAAGVGHFANLQGIRQLDDGLTEALGGGQDGTAWDETLIAAFPDVFRRATDLNTNTQAMINFRFYIWNPKDWRGDQKAVNSMQRPGMTMIFAKGDQAVYCLDYTANAQGDRQDYLLSEIQGKPYINENKLKEVYRWSYGLTYNNFRLIRENASAIAKAYDSSFNHISKAAVEALLRSESPVGLTFKQQLVQWAVWYVMNEMPLMDAREHYQTGGGFTGQYDKDGNPIISGGNHYDELLTPFSLFDIGVMIGLPKDPLPEDLIVSMNPDDQGVQPTTTGIPKEAPAEMLYAGLAVQKQDADLGTSPQGDASFSDIRFAIINETGKTQKNKDGEEIADGQVMQIITGNAVGEAATGPRDLPFREGENRYRITELQTDDAVRNHVLQRGVSGMANASMKRSAADLTVTMDPQNPAVVQTVTAPFKNSVSRGSLSLIKKDAELSAAEAQGDASLAGIRFALINRSAKAIALGGRTIRPGQVAEILTTDAAGRAQTAERSLPYGTYEVVELSLRHAVSVGEEYAASLNGKSDDANTQGYRYQAQAKNFVLREEGQRQELVFSNAPARGGVILAKWSLETNERKAQGGLSLAGAVFKLTNRSEKKVIVDGKTYAPGDAWEVRVGEDGLFRSPKDWLPYGTYAVDEVSAPKGYLLQGILHREFTIREHAATVSLDGEDGAIKNAIPRGDLRGVKVENGSEAAMGGVVFSLTSMTTGEMHLLVTDENGELSTASDFAPHSRNTNANDAALKDGVLKESGLDPSAGIWFSGSANVTVKADDTRGALPLDRYLLNELPCSANAGRTLIKNRVISVSGNGHNVRLGTLRDTPLTLFTSAGGKTGKEVEAKEQSVITDLIYYSGLQSGKNYIVKTKIYDQTTDAFVTDENGEELVLITDVKAVGTDGHFEVEIPFDGRDLITHKLVVFEYLYEQEADPLKDAPLIAHEDPEDEAQTVTVVEKEEEAEPTGVKEEKETPPEAEPSPAPSEIPPEPSAAPDEKKDAAPEAEVTKAPDPRATVTPSPDGGPSLTSGNPAAGTNQRTGSGYAVSNARAVRTGESGEIFFVTLLFCGSAGILLLLAARRKRP